MAKAKMHPVIVDRSVTVELKNKPTITYPAGWRGEVNKATLKVIKDMEAGREVEGDGGAATDADTTDADIKAKHEAADAEIEKKKKVALDQIDLARSDADKKAASIIADAEKQAQKIVADAEKASKKTGA